MHVLLGLLALNAPLVAPTFDLNYGSFASTSGLNLVGSATRQGTTLRLTPSSPGQNGAMWALAKQNVAAPFRCQFTFRMIGAADGMAFVIQDQSVSALGPDGQELAYGGITKSLAIEFDTFVNAGIGDPSENHVAVVTRGVQANSSNHANALASTSLVVDLNNAALHTATIEYVPGLLRIFVDDTQPALQVAVDLNATLGLTGGDAWVGFTAGTGGLFQSHTVNSWTFDENWISPPNGVPPSSPTITAPTPSQMPVDPTNVVIELSSFVDGDGDGHASTDYEIWSVQPSERVWQAASLNGLGLVRASLSDGVFQGGLTGQSALSAQSSYVARARFRDDSGEPATEWGSWTELPLETGVAAPTGALVLADLRATPAPRLRFAASGMDVDLPFAATPTRIALESATGALISEVIASSGPGNVSSDAAALAQPTAVRLRVDAGSSPLALGRTDLEVYDDACGRVRILLPELALSAGSTALFWVADDGATWAATAGQSTPDFSTSARIAATGWQTASPDYEVQVVAADLQLPVNLAFVPQPGPAPDDPYLYVTELYGAIKVISNDGTVSDYATGLLNFNPLGFFPGAGEQGLGGLVVDPLTGDLYLSLLYDAGGPHYPRVVRFTSNDGGRTAATQTTILDMPGETQGQAHYISHLELLADRTLLVHMGDGFQSNTARSLGSFRGKILRMNLDGSPPTDNPFYTAGQVTARDYVWVRGVRNPFGGRTRAADGAHYFVENGPDIDRFARVVPGRDYLWAGQNSQMLNFAIYAWQPAVGPVNLAWVEPETFGGSGFPIDKQGHAFVSEAGETYSNGPGLRGKRISEFELDAQGALVSGPSTFLQYTGPGRSATIGLAAGTDGLYFTDLYRELGGNPVASGAHVLRVSYVGDPPAGCGPLGQRYCDPVVTNSSGERGDLDVRGSDEVLANDYTLEISQLPPFTFALVVASQVQDFVPNAGGSTGHLCLGGTIGRFNALIANAGPTGAFDVAMDLGSFPPPLAAVSPGETWNFQVWFRDFQFVQTSNYTNGFTTTFR